MIKVYIILKKTRDIWFVNWNVKSGGYLCVHFIRDEMFFLVTGSELFSVFNSDKSLYHPEKNTRYMVRKLECQKWGLSVFNYTVYLSLKLQ